jgi:hypothetical protein
VRLGQRGEAGQIDEREGAYYLAHVYTLPGYARNIGEGSRKG